MPLILLLAVLLFIAADLLIRYIHKQITEKKIREERESALKESIRLDYSTEAKSLKRVEVNHPKARFLCVDDEEVVLDSFRKILVLDGYSIDTVTGGREGLGLVQKNPYDFVFSDLKMPEMDGVEFTKSVKHLRPDVDVVIITGYASVETAVECMKHGAMDYVQKPFTDDELLAFVKKIRIKRQDRIDRQLRPKVHIMKMTDRPGSLKCEFGIPGGVFISPGHCWVSVQQDGHAKVGMDDFAKKLLGKITGIDFPGLGTTVRSGQPLFSVQQGTKKLVIHSPVSGKILQINSVLTENPDLLDATPYDSNWICVLDTDNIDADLKNMSIGKAAVSLYQSDIETVMDFLRKTRNPSGASEYGENELYIGELERLSPSDWETITSKIFQK